MNFLKTLLWVAVAIVAVIFSMNNWVHVPVKLWGGIVAEINLPLLLLLSFLLGLLPTFVWHRAIRWRYRRRLESTERALADARSLAIAGEPGEMPPAPASQV